MIRKWQEADIEPVMKIWLQGNKDAHPFIPPAYWESNFEAVREQIAQAEVYVAEVEGSIRGFVGLVDGYIAGIFVDSECRSQGVGKQLLDYAKRLYPVLTLSVYQKNSRAVAFYRREGFSVVSGQRDEDTGELEYTMNNMVRDISK